VPTIKLVGLTHELKRFYCCHYSRLARI